MLSVVAYRLLLFCCGFGAAWLTGRLIRDEIAYERKMREQMRRLERPACRTRLRTSERLFGDMRFVTRNEGGLCCLLKIACSNSNDWSDGVAHRRLGNS